MGIYIFVMIKKIDMYIFYVKIFIFVEVNLFFILSCVDHALKNSYKKFLPLSRLFIYYSSSYNYNNDTTIMS